MKKVNQGKPPQKKKPNPVIGYVDANRTYTIDGLCKAIGVEERTIREARMNGLVTRLIGGRRLIIAGSEFNEWARTLAPIAPLPRGKGRTTRMRMTTNEPTCA